MNRYRYLIAGLLSLFLLTAASAETQAEQGLPFRLSQSIENSGDASAEVRLPLFAASPLQIEPSLVRLGQREEGRAIGERLAAHSGGGQFFSIYNAETLLTQDDDEDGFYSELRVTFDADVDSGSGSVYARLYVSFEGGPWNHYYTTESFHINGDESGDDFEVVTRLLDGYPSGYYDLLIELYDADWGEHVASFGPYEDRALSVLPLEDQGRDVGHHSSHGGGGSLDMLSLMLLGFVGLMGRFIR